MDDKKLTIEDIQKIKEEIGEPQLPLGLTVIENSFLPDHVIMVSSNMYEALKQQSKPSDRPNIPGMPL